MTKQLHILTMSITHGCMLPLCLLLFFVTIIDSRVTDLTAEQSDLTAVRITWTEKPGSGEYDIRVSDGRSLSSYYGGSPYIFMSRVLGVHIIQEIGTRHFPGAKTSVTVKGIIIKAEFKGARGV